MENTNGMLYLCATPIGNLEDITLRVLRTLEEADIIFCEDTRNSLKLLRHFEIAKPLSSYHDHSHNPARNTLRIWCVKASKSLSLVTPACRLSATRALI